MRFEFISPDAEAETIYEFKLTPVSGYEVRNSVDEIQILDYKNGNRVLVNSGDVNVIFTGVLNATRTEDVFSVPTLTTVNGQKIDDDSGVGLFFDDFYPGSNRGYYSDAWARVAEFFMHEELRATTQQPEHEIVYINTQTENDTIPDYANLSMVGLNISSTQTCLLYTSPSPRDRTRSRMPSSA